MNGISFYKEEIRDCNAVYFTEEFFNVKNDGSIDVSNELQNAIKTVVDKAGYGVLFIPEGVTEQLKEETQMLWAQKMNNIRARAEEIVREEIIYCNG